VARYYADYVRLFHLFLNDEERRADNPGVRIRRRDDYIQFSGSKWQRTFVDKLPNALSVMLWSRPFLTPRHHHCGGRPPAFQTWLAGCRPLHHLSNRVFKSYDDIVEHCCHAWRKLQNQPWKITSIGMRNWAHGF
jgi:hypothetical protein